MTQTTTFHVKQITYETGNTEITILSPAQWAGRLRRKGYKKTIISKKELATLTIKIKTIKN